MTIREHFSPQSGIEVPSKATKMLFTLFNAGKGSGSTVKFAKFYLIVDARAFQRCHLPNETDQENESSPNLLSCLLKFSAALKKAVSTGKIGESAFKPNEEGSYFNAFPTIAETLKQIEDAIAASGANGQDESRPASSLQKPKTADSKQRKETPGGAEENKTPAVTASDWTAKKPFRIGVNCDSEAFFNKDPKEPNKYEVEGQKVPVASQ